MAIEYPGKKGGKKASQRPLKVGEDRARSEKKEEKEEGEEEAGGTDLCYKVDVTVNTR